MKTTTKPSLADTRVADQRFGRTLGEVVANYRILGWKVKVADNRVMLPLGPSTTALVMPARIGSAVLAELRARMLAGPALVIPGATEHWVFLAELVALLPSQLRTPPEIRFVRSPRSILLPPTATPYGSIRWANAPSFNRHWLPPFTAVLAVARTVLSGSS